MTIGLQFGARYNYNQLLLTNTVHHVAVSRNITQMAGPMVMNGLTFRPSGFGVERSAWLSASPQLEPIPQNE